MQPKLSKNVKLVLNAPLLHLIKQGLNNSILNKCGKVPMEQLEIF